jgi:hypothetical protein
MPLKACEKIVAAKVDTNAADYPVKISFLLVNLHDSMR